MTLLSLLPPLSQWLWWKATCQARSAGSVCTMRATSSNTYPSPAREQQEHSLTSSYGPSLLPPSTSIGSPYSRHSWAGLRSRPTLSYSWEHPGWRRLQGEHAIITPLISCLLRGSSWTCTIRYACFLLPSIDRWRSLPSSTIALSTRASSQQEGAQRSSLCQRAPLGSPSAMRRHTPSWPAS